MTDNKDDSVDFLMEMLETQGVAASTVSDGTILMFKRSVLQSILDKNLNQEKIMIFVKRPTFSD